MGRAYKLMQCDDGVEMAYELMHGGFGRAYRLMQRDGDVERAY